jgi:peptidoglycan hydrolase CwlO-like protein
MISFATSKTDLQNQASEIQKKINETSSQISDVKKEVSSTMKQIEKLNEEISGYENQIDELNVQLTTLEKEIETEQIKLNQAQAKYEKQEIMLKERIVAQYESGQTTYLDVLLSSAGITDFISNYYLVSEIATYDQELLDQMEKNRNEIQLAKEKLEESKDQIATVKLNKEKTSNALKNSQATKQAQVNNLSEEEKQLQAELDQLIKDNREIDAKIRALNITNSKTYNVIPSSSGYIYPVPGYTTITTGMYYSDGRLHKAADFSRTEYKWKTYSSCKIRDSCYYRLCFRKLW